MRIFVTGASGWIGSAVVPELLAAGHQVLGLARSDAAGRDDRRARRRGPPRRPRRPRQPARRRGRRRRRRPPRATTTTSPGWTTRRRPTDAAIEAIGDALAGTDRPLRDRLRHARARARPASAPRRTLPAPTRCTRGSPTRQRRPGVRRPRRARRRSCGSPRPCTAHGDHGFIADLVGIARDTGVSGYIGDGANRWPAVHRARRRARWSGSRVERRTGRLGRCTPSPRRACRPATIAEAIGRGLGLPVASIPAERGRRALRLDGAVLRPRRDRRRTR